MEGASLERQLALQLRAAQPHSDAAAAPLHSDRTPRTRTIGVPGVAVRDPRRVDVVCPGYAGHCPGEKMRFGRSPSFHRPSAEANHEATPRGQSQTKPFPRHREGSESAHSVRLARPTTAWEEVGDAARRQMMRRSSSAENLAAAGTPRSQRSPRSATPPRSATTPRGNQQQQHQQQHHQHHHHDSSSQHLWTPRTPYKERVGGVVSGYRGYLPGAQHHFGSPTTGMRSAAGQHETLHHPNHRRPLEQRDHPTSGVLGAPRALSPSATRLTHATTVGYQGHVPSLREAHGRAAWRANADVEATGRGWRPGGTPRSAMRARQLSRADGQAARAVRNAMDDARVQEAVSKNWRHITSPSRDQWRGLAHVDYGSHTPPTAGKHIAWPHSGFGAYGTSDAVLIA
jgi:hypothetical protein